MLRRLFIDHPNDLGETYFDHQRHAAGYGLTLILAGLACLVHAVFPGLFTATGSRTIGRLHSRMTERQGAGRRTTPDAAISSRA